MFLKLDLLRSFLASLNPVYFSRFKPGLKGRDIRSEIKVEEKAGSSEAGREEINRCSRLL